MTEILLIVHLAAMSAMLGATVVNGRLHTRARARALPPDGAAPLLGAIMAPSLGLILASGLWLALATGYALTAPWVIWGIGIALALILAFVLGLRPERRLEALAEGARGQGVLPAADGPSFLRAAPIGVAALALSLAGIAMMVAKPM